MIEWLRVITALLFWGAVSVLAAIVVAAYFAINDHDVYPGLDEIDEYDVRFKPKTGDK